MICPVQFTHDLSALKKRGEAGGLETPKRNPIAAVERMMKLQDVLLKAMAKKITWWEAAEIIGVTDRTMRRWRERLDGRVFRAGRSARARPTRSACQTFTRRSRIRLLRPSRRVAANSKCRGTLSAFYLRTQGITAGTEELTSSPCGQQRAAEGSEPISGLPISNGRSWERDFERERNPQALFLEVLWLGARD